MIHFLFSKIFYRKLSTLESGKPHPENREDLYPELSAIF
jgi:hypothetical protein